MSAQSGLVLKVGGDVLLDAQQRQGLSANIVALREQGWQVVVVHGAGPQATALQKRLGIEVHKVGGRRITCDATLQVMKYAQAGEVNVDLIGVLSATGLPALGLSGVSCGLVRATRRPPRVVSGAGSEPVDFGWVGDVAGINVDLIRRLLDLDLLPVIASLGADAEGQAYNINADVVAAEMARALGVKALVLATAVGGIFADVEDLSSRLPLLDAAAARRAIEQGVITGGMIPKVEESLAVLGQAPAQILIVDVRQPDAVSRGLASPGSMGTSLVTEEFL